MFDKFSETAAQVVVMAQDEAKSLGHSYVGTEHLLLAILKLGSGSGAQVLNSFGMTYDLVKSEVISMVGVNREKIGSSPQMTPRAKRILELAYDEARFLGHEKILAEHILLGIIREGEGIAAHLIRRFGVNLSQLRKKLVETLSPGEQEEDEERGKTQPVSYSQSPVKQLEPFGVDLTRLAAEGKLDPIIGREKEIERIIQILSRRKKNNPALIGEPGVGKTAIVEGLAQKIVKGDVPETLRNKIIFSLDVASLVAGTKYRGEFEKRMKKLLHVIRKSGDIIVFIDEMHSIVGAGSAEGAVDASNILKPALARGEFRCIGATTPDEYRKYIEKDAALERRFQKVYVVEPTPEETLEILRGLKHKYEIHHRVHYTDEALRASVELSQRYISDHFFPDKAIDVIDEAGSRARLKVLTAPREIKELMRSIEEVRARKELAVANQDFEMAAELREKELEMEETYRQLYNEWRKEAEAEIALVDVDEVAEVVSNWTGIPLKKLEETESEKLLRLELALHKRIVAQEEAIKAVSKAIRRARSGIKDPRRPVGTFMFLGPTGVGKTELAKALAEYLFGDEKALLRFDMSEYMERFSVSRLIGAPPGYVGYEEGGTLTEQVRRRPFSVILFDEIEKAHPDVFNLLLQIMDDGRLTDSQGRVIDFRNTIIIMTSNLGGELINKSKRALGFVEAENVDQDYKTMKETVLSEVRRTFRPEFLNRVDEIVVFHALTREHVDQIIDILMRDIEARLREKGLSIRLTKSAREFLVEKGYSPVYGARPLKRAMQQYLEDPLAEAIIRGDYEPGDTITCSARQGRLHFRKRATKAKATV
ncbi:MAG: ATP-dependent Clp protease ATP-binding subunit ClpC [Thermotogae bacterium]|nr:MAG: ATP-dependent Clp protease ATP-binding subunit ClpC [Thermotogota bacterium]